MCHALTAEKIRFIDGKVFYHRYFLPCNSWSCEECAKVKAHKIAVKSRKGFAGDRVRFMTLTARTGLSISEMLRSLKESWNRLRTELTRNGKKLKYFWCIEAGEKNHRPHMHILIDRYINQKRLSRLAYRCGFGKVCDIRGVKDSSVFNYVTKYLSKGIGCKTVELALKAQNGRRYGTSRGFCPEEKPEKKGVTLNIFKPTASESYERVSANLANIHRKQGFEFQSGKRQISFCLGEVEPWDANEADFVRKLQTGVYTLRQFLGKPLLSALYDVVPEYMTE